MASEAIGAAYVLTDEGADQLASLASRGSAPVASAGFRSHYRDAHSDRLGALEALVRHRSAS